MQAKPTGEYSFYFLKKGRFVEVPGHHYQMGNDQGYGELHEYGIHVGIMDYGSRMEVIDTGLFDPQKKEELMGAFRGEVPDPK